MNNPLTRHAPFLARIVPLVCISVGIGAAYFPLFIAMAGLRNEESYSFILIIPFISAFFAFRNRRQTLCAGTHITWSGLAPIGAGIVLYIIGLAAGRIGHDVLPATLLALSCIASIIGACAIVWGWQSVRRQLFPVLFLLFAVPLPPIILGAITTYLQYGSAEVVNLIFKASGMAYIRDGCTFHFPAMTIYIAEECSGIRSTIALVIITVLAGQISLRSPWRKLILAIWVLPVSLIKNGIRIATLSFLANYVDPKYITSSYLHHQGGFVFYAVSLIFIFAVLAILRFTEKKKPAADKGGQTGMKAASGLARGTSVPGSAVGPQTP